jgi:hypothetical protein
MRSIREIRRPPPIIRKEPLTAESGSMRMRPPTCTAAAVTLRRRFCYERRRTIWVRRSGGWIAQVAYADFGSEEAVWGRSDRYTFFCSWRSAQLPSFVGFSHRLHGGTRGIHRRILCRLLLWVVGGRDPMPKVAEPERHSRHLASRFSRRRFCANAC